MGIIQKRSLPYGGTSIFTQDANEEEQSRDNGPDIRTLSSESHCNYGSEEEVACDTGLLLLIESRSLIIGQKLEKTTFERLLTRKIENEYVTGSFRNEHKGKELAWKATDRDTLAEALSWRQKRWLALWLPAASFCTLVFNWPVHKKVHHVRGRGTK